MGFSGGGSNVLKPHKHSSAVQDGSPLDMNNVTEATLSAGDIVYSDGAALQRLAIGSTTNSLVVSGGVPSWANLQHSVPGEIVVMANSTTIGDYTQPASATCSSSVVVDLTWEQLDYDKTRNAQTDDDFAYGVVVDSSIVASGNVTNVQINFAGSQTGTVHCVRWDDLTAATQTNAADMLTAANHTYWSKDASTLSAGMTAESVTQSTANVTGNIIGFVLTGSGTLDLPVRLEGSLAGYTTYKFNSGSPTDTTDALTFTITTAASSCANAIDDDVTTSWESTSEVNPNIYVDMSSSTTTSNLALYPNAGTTETEIKIQSSTDAIAWNDKRTITWSNLTEGAWNYIRFNIVSARYWRIYGSSGNSVVMQIDEIKVLDAVSDADVRNLHGHIPISATDTSLNNAGV